MAAAALAAMACAGCSSVPKLPPLPLSFVDVGGTHRPTASVPWYFRRGPGAAPCPSRPVEPALAPIDRVGLRLDDLEALAIARRERGPKRAVGSLYDTTAEVARLLGDWPELQAESEAMAAVARQIDSAGEAEMEPLIDRLLQLSDTVRDRLGITARARCAPPPRDVASRSTSRG